MFTSTPTVPEPSDTSHQLLQDSEQHVRRIGAENGLFWDQGMDNTVAAVARQALGQADAREQNHPAVAAQQSPQIETPALQRA